MSRIEAGPVWPADCELCGEPLTIDAPPDLRVRGTWGHRECFLRNGVGGIGHIIAHEYWCARGDPDAGLTFRQSALLVAAMADVVGWETMLRRTESGD